jgi:hypothetical protein
MIRIKRITLLLLAICALILGAFIGCGPRSGPDDELVFSGLVEMGAGVGERLPGADIEVVRISENEAEIHIEGQTARKKPGDSLDWHGALDSHVNLDLALRILWISEDIVQSGGAAKLTIADANPRAASVQSRSEIEYALPITYSVRKGDTIPGTLITYVGRDMEKGAEFAGIEGYPFRKVADSLTWEGQLRDNVWLKLDLRVILFTESTLQAGGVATIWVDQ